MPPPEAPNSLYSRRKGPSSRNFACTTSAAPTGVPARGRTRAPTERRPDSTRRRGAAHNPHLGVQNRPEARRRVPALPAPTPTPPALACYDSELQLLRLAPPAVSTAAEESLRAGSA